MYLTEERLAPLMARYGHPRVVEITQAVSISEMDMVRHSRKDERAHDFTCFILDGNGRVAVIRKHFHAPGIWRAPSGGVRPGEDVEEGILREMREETGLMIRLVRYLLRVNVTFVCGDVPEVWRQPWVSHVFVARPVETVGEGGGVPGPAGEAGGVPPELEPQDRHEIAAARWATVEELQGPIRAALLATGTGLFRYRVALTDLAVAAMQEFIST